MPYKDPSKKKEYMKNYHERNKEKNTGKAKSWYEKNKEKQQKYNAIRDENIRQHGYDSIISSNINDAYTWDVWCGRIKSGAKKSKHPYSDDFTNDIMFEMMLQGCFYCGNVATTIDRIDSNLDHKYK